MSYKDVQVKGLKLVEVWEINYEARKRPLRSAGVKWSIHSGIATCPNSLNPFQVWDKERKQGMVSVA
jgi:hypothetical protein